MRAQKLLGARAKNKMGARIEGEEWVFKFMSQCVNIYVQNREKIILHVPVIPNLYARTPNNKIYSMRAPNIFFE